MTRPSQRAVDLRFVPIDQIRPNAWNVQKQDDLTFQRLVEEIKEVGFIDPLEVVPEEGGGYTIIGGEHRWRAAQQAGLDELPCSVLTDAKWKSEDLQKFTSVRVNVLKGRIDPEKFANLYREMADKYGAESIQQLMGFVDTKGFQKLVGDVRKGVKKTLPKELQDEFDRKAKDAKTVEDLGSIIQHLFAKYGDSVGRSFVVFTYGKAEHCYIQADRVTKKAVDQLVALSKDKDINEILGPLLRDGVARLLKERRAAEKGAAKIVPDPDSASDPF